MAKTLPAKPPAAPKAKAEDKSTAKETAETPVKGGAKVAPPKPGAKPNALQKPELAAIVGANPIARGEVVSKVWVYIKEKNLQNPANKREILADAALHKVFGKDKVTMFEMNKHLARHLS
jgi:upstream activation factor subunit UAF30